MNDDPMLGPIAGTEPNNFAGMQIHNGRAGNARVQRLIYAPGGRWSTHVKPLVGTDWCEHGHVGFLARGHFVGEYADGTSFDYTAPAVIAVDPGHDSWVEGDEHVVIIQFDLERDTIGVLGLTPRTKP